LARNIPRARARFHEQHDHMTLLVAMLDRIVTDLIEMAL
jgi:hypothetical protein